MGDRNNAMEGKGLEVGSWGSVGGRDVGLGMGLMNSSSEDGEGSLLGSIGSMRSNGSRSSSIDEDDDEMEEDIVENRIMVIADDKQEPNIQKVLDRFQTILTDKITTPITIDYYKPTANIPLGGNSAQCVIISSTSLSNGQSSANNILSRILRRTIAPMGGKISKPPSHFIILSPLGTERIDKFPYSMTNMMNGNKLKKAREVEEVIISTVKGRLVADSSSNGGAPSLDYTIIKLGDIVDDESLLKKKDGVMEIAPGDSLDGKVGIESAANTLFQSTLLRPTARNATISVIGASKSSSDTDAVEEDQWQDWFLRLAGPELWRRDGLLPPNEIDIERKFEQLAGFIDEWSDVFKNGAKGTGLTTPVQVVPSTFENDIDNTSIVKNRFGVRLEFKQTNTGSAYRSKDEEREIEKQRPQSSQSTYQKPGGTSSTINSGRKQQREGGVEIVVEWLESADGKNDLRVRARRCNMGDFTVVKELSEETIVKRLEKAVEIWNKQ